MTWKRFFLIFIFFYFGTAAAPFIDLDVVHQANNEFEINLIFNENRNIPIIMVTVSRNDSKNSVINILEQVFETQSKTGFAIVVDCRNFVKNLNNTLQICGRFDPNEAEVEGKDPNFLCQFMSPNQLKIRVKGHTLMKTHTQEYLGDGSNFNANYLSQMIKQNIPDLVTYVEDKYDFDQFLQLSSEFKASKKPKLLYFDDNFLAPQFLRKLASILEGRADVGTTDDLSLLAGSKPAYDELYLLEYNYELKKYTRIRIDYNIDDPINSILEKSQIKQILKIKKNRDILLDFEHASPTIYNFTSIKQIYNLQSHARIIVLQISKNKQNFDCPQILPIYARYETLFNYVCFSSEMASLIPDSTSNSNSKFFFITSTLEDGSWVDFNKEELLKQLPQVISRQRVSSETQAEHCLRTAAINKKDPIFFYFREKSGEERTYIINYLNSLPQVTSLQYFCQIYLPDEQLTHKFGLKINTIFTMFDPNNKGQAQKMEHSRIQNFGQIKMFLRQISIKRMEIIYQDKLFKNKVKEIKNSEQLTEECFSKKCIIGFIAVGKYRQSQEIEIMKQMKLLFEDEFNFVWIDGICHWDIGRQLKILKKKEKIIDQSHIFYYDEKDTSYRKWTSKKFWDKKELKRWIKQLRNNQKIGHLRFAIDMQDRLCAKKEKPAEQL